jgi:hypothetical protein
MQEAGVAVLFRRLKEVAAAAAIASEILQKHEIDETRYEREILVYFAIFGLHSVLEITLRGNNEGGNCADDNVEFLFGV